MKIDRKEFLTALQSANPGVASKATVEQSTTFVFEGGRVYTYNDEISVSVPIALDVEGSVVAKKLLELVGKFSTKEIEIHLKDDAELLITSGKSDAGLRFDPDIRLPLEELGSPKDWTKLPKKFTEAVKFCLFSAGKDQNSYLLTNIHIHDGFVESSDGYRATRYDIQDGFGDGEAILIPATSARHLVNYAPAEYARTDGWLHFRNEGDVIFSCRWPEGEEYPSIDDYINTTGEKIQLPDGLDKVIERGVVLADGERITLIMNGKEMLLATENDDGWFEEETEVQYKGKPMEFDIYPEFLNTILKVKADTFVAPNLMRFETDDFTHVVALLAPKKRK